MATIEQCREAITRLSAGLGRAEGKVRSAAALDRSLSCWITDLDVTFAGRLSDGSILDVTEYPGRPAERAQIRLAMRGDILVALVDGELNFAQAWATGRVRFEAGFRDLLRLRSLL
ncbi:sterol-binding protein [Phaeacidiphilus oryzae]|uniref:sterol-binding protein n=1 Tax=Phaeacidiphilus oryzae TaxID=348818 RepID=UPI000561C161|nr:sterol-binding protein [Phaeacidiphilus oryzae]